MGLAVWSPSRDDGVSDALLGVGLPVADRSVPLRKQAKNRKKEDVFLTTFFFAASHCVFVGCCASGSRTERPRRQGVCRDQSSRRQISRDWRRIGGNQSEVVVCFHPPIDLFLTFSFLSALFCSWLSEHCPAPEAPVGRQDRLRSVIGTSFKFLFVCLASSSSSRHISGSSSGMLERALALVNKLSIDSRDIVLANYVEISLHEFLHSAPQLSFTIISCFAAFL